jgi:hypothetical protein
LVETAGRWLASMGAMKYISSAKKKASFQS